MAIKTMSASTGGNGQYSSGWHELTISKAEYGVYKSPNGDKRYIDVWFNDYPQNMNLRVYETVAKQSGEEFRIANLFKYANAGIISKMDDPTGKRPRYQYDDEASGLVGKRVNVYFYKETKTGKGYSRMFDNIAPVEQEGEVISYSADAVNAIKSGVEANYLRLHGNNSASNGFANTTQGSNSDLDSAPF